MCPKCVDQAVELASAVANAINDARETGADPGGFIGDLMPGARGCGDWQVIIATALAKVVNKHAAAGDLCFNFNYVEGTGGVHHGVRQHQWIEITPVSGKGGSVVIDPWLNDGEGDVTDTSMADVWPTKARWPFPIPLRPANPPATAPTEPTTRPTTQPSTCPCK